MVGVLSCRERNASTANSGVGSHARRTFICAAMTAASSTRLYGATRSEHIAVLETERQTL